MENCSEFTIIFIKQFLWDPSFKNSSVLSSNAKLTYEEYNPLGI